MAKVLPIVGTPNATLLGYALGKARAMEQGQISFQKKIQADNAIVEFRRAPNGVVTAFVKSTSAYAAVFSGVQVPETVLVEGTIPVDDRPKLRTGVFPKTEYFPDQAPRQRLLGRTRFGISPYSKKFIRYSQLSFGPTSDDGHQSPYSGPLTGRFYSVYDDTGKVAREAQLFIYADPDTSFEYLTSVQSNNFVPSISTGNRALLATREYSTQYSYSKTSDASVIDATGTQTNIVAEDTTSVTNIVGSSWIRLRLVSGKNGESKYRIVDVAKLPIAQQDVLIKKNIPTDVYIARSENTRISTNDLLPSLPARTWHAMEFVTVAPNGATFVLRETNQTTFQQQNQSGVFVQFVGMPPETTARQSSASRGLTLSFVAPDDTVLDGVYSKDIGEFGYLVNVIPSASNKKVYVYYGLHDSTIEPKPPEAAALPYNGAKPFLPKRYNEFLDVIDITAKKIGDVTSYTFVKSKTLSLGPVTLRTLQPLGSAPGQGVIGTDHYESKLYGAALEVAGFIWGNRFCFDTKKLTMTEIPDYYDHGLSETDVTSVFERRRNAVTDADNWPFTYSTVSNNGQAAGFYALKFGESLFYQLTTDNANKLSIKKLYSIAIPGDFRLRPLTEIHGTYGSSAVEDLAGQTIQFQKPSL